MDRREDNCIKDPMVVLCLILDRHRPRIGFPDDHRQLAQDVCERMAQACRANDGELIKDVTRPLDLVAIDNQDSEPRLHIREHGVWHGYEVLESDCRKLQKEEAVKPSKTHIDAHWWVLTFHDVLAVEVALQMQGLRHEEIFKSLKGALEHTLSTQLASLKQPGVFGASIWEIGVVSDNALVQGERTTCLGSLEMSHRVKPFEMQDFRFLISERNDDVYIEEVVPHKDSYGLVVPPLLWLETGRLKLERIRADYAKVREEMQSYHLRITRVTEWFVYFQQRSYRELAELGSDEWEELRGKSQSLVQQLASLESVMAQIDDALVTADIAKKNYRKIQERWQLSPGSLITTLSADADVFIEQARSDLRYFQNLAQRIRSVLNSVQFQLQLADPTLRKGFEMGKVLLPQFALMGAILSIALRVGFPFNNLWLLAGTTTAAWVVGRLIGSSRILVHWQRLLGSASIASAFTAIVAPQSLTWTLFIWLSSFSVVYILDTIRVVRSSVKAEFKRERKEQQTRLTESELSAIFTEHYKENLQLIREPIPEFEVARKLEYARDALYDLLAELPPTEIYRPKDFNSFLEKMTRKKYVSVAQIPDAIGIRYVVPPWKMRHFRNRVCDRLQPRIVEESYHSYFSGGYRAIHLVIDLWGVYASINGRKFPYMSAEVQIKTALNNTWANLGHDFVYKSMGSPNPAVKFVLVCCVLPLFRVLSRIELRLFWKWMGWVKQYELKDIGLFLAERSENAQGSEVYAFAIAPGSLADNSGVKKGMYLMSINSEPMYKLTTCVKMLEKSNNHGSFIFEFIDDEDPNQANVQLTVDRTS